MRKKPQPEPRDWAIVYTNNGVDYYSSHTDLTKTEAEDQAFGFRTYSTRYTYTAVPVSVVPGLTRHSGYTKEDRDRWEERYLDISTRAKKYQSALIRLAKTTGVYDNYVTVVGRVLSDGKTVQNIPKFNLDLLIEDLDRVTNEQNVTDAKTRLNVTVKKGAK